MMKIQNFLFSLFLLLFISQCGDFNVHQGLIVFVTSTLYDGDFTAASGNGLAGGDFLCNQAATNAELAGTFRAWLSTSTVNAIDRISDRKYVRTGDYAVVGYNRSDFTDGTISNAINRTEFGAAVADGPVWTGTDTAGTAHANTCTNWTVVGGGPPPNGRQGATGAINSQWTSNGNTACAATATAQLYCFQID